ncbi:MAG: rod-binding protein [Nitrospinota bacterium]
MNTEYRIQNTEDRIQKAEVRSMNQKPSAVSLQPSVSKEGEDKKLKKLTSEFESVFLYYVLKSMRDTVPKSGFIYGKSGEEIYRSMMDQEMAKNMAERRETGISDILFKQLATPSQQRKGLR